MKPSLTAQPDVICSLKKFACAVTVSVLFWGKWENRVVNGYEGVGYSIPPPLAHFTQNFLHSGITFGIFKLVYYLTFPHNNGRCLIKTSSLLTYALCKGVIEMLEYIVRFTYISHYRVERREERKIYMWVPFWFGKPFHTPLNSGFFKYKMRRIYLSYL